MPSVFQRNLVTERARMAAGERAKKAVGSKEHLP
jgi:hypothetical protein